MTKGKEVLDRVRGKLLSLAQINNDAELGAAFRGQFNDMMLDFLSLDANIQSLERDVVIERLLGLSESVQTIAQQMMLNEQEVFFSDQPLTMDTEPETKQAEQPEEPVEIGKVSDKEPQEDTPAA